VTRGPGDPRSAAEICDYLGETVVAGDVLCLHDGIGRGTFSPHDAFARDLADRRELEVQALPSALARIADRGISLMPAGRLLARSQASPTSTPGAPEP
jgi:hypothetical protein